jgi:hypothetical protein
MEYLISIVLNIVGNLLTPAARQLLRWPAEPDNPQPIAPPSVSSPLPEEEKELIRAYNRERLERAGRILWIHGITFFFLFAAFYLPLLVKTMPNQDILLSMTRFGSLGLEGTFSRDGVGWLSLVLTLALYLPLWLLSQPIGHVVATIWDQVQRVSPTRYASLIALSFFALSFLVAGHWVYVLFPKNSYLMSLGLPFFAVFGIGALSSNRR